MSKGDKIATIGIILTLLVCLSTLGYFVLTERVDQTELAIRIDKRTGLADLDNVYTAGRYYIGFFGGFVYYPASIQEFDFANSTIVRTRTNDGLWLEVKVWIQYRIPSGWLLQIDSDGRTMYENYPTFEQTQGRLYQIARTVINNVVSRYEAIQIYQAREMVENALKVELNDKLAIMGLDFVDAGFRSIDLPDAFENSQLQKKIAEEKVVQASFELQEQEIQAQKRVVDAEADANVTKIAADAQAYAEYAVIRKLNLTQEQYIRLQYIWALENLDDATLVIQDPTADTMIVVDSMDDGLPVVPKP